MAAIKESDIADTEEAKIFIEFVDTSERGLAGGSLLRY